MEREKNQPMITHTEHVYLGGGANESSAAELVGAIQAESAEPRSNMNMTPNAQVSAQIDQSRKPENVSNLQSAGEGDDYSDDDDMEGNETPNEAKSNNRPLATR